MKALTLTQPWATLVAIGAKRIETRSWETLYRGPLLIHAAQGLGPAGGKLGLMDLCSREPFHSVLKEHGRQWLAGRTDVSSMINSPLMPQGVIVAVVNLIDCIPTHHPMVAVEPGKPWFTGARKGVGQQYYEVPPPADSNEFAFGNYAPGRFAWLLDDVKPLATPIPAKGALGLWNWEGTIEV